MSLRRITPTVPLTDGVVSLRRPRAGDVDLIQRYIVLADAQSWLSGSGDASALYEEYVAGWDAPDEPNRFGLTLIVTRLVVDELVGVVHLEPRDGVLHVAYGVAPHHRRVGVASRALTLCCAWAMNEGFGRVDLEIGEDNVPSQGVARRCGFEPAGQTRSQVVDGGGVWHARRWSLLVSSL